MNTDLTNTYQKLRESSKEYMTNKSILLKEKNELELQNKEYFKQIEKLTANYVSNIRFKSFRSIIRKYDCNIINIKFIIVIL